MFALPDAALTKLADFHLASSVLLAAAMLATAVLRQPARRLAIAWGSVLALALLMALAIVPRWSVVHLSRLPGASEIAIDYSNAEGHQVAVPIGSAPWAGFSSRSFRPRVIHYPLDFQGNGWWPRVTKAISSAVVGGGVIATAWLLAGSLAARRIVAQAKPADDETKRLLDELAYPGQSPRLLVTDRLGTAFAVGLWRPAILLPERMASGDARGDLRAILTHELAHVRGGDLWLLAALRLLLVALWPNPLYWALRRRVQLDQELLADAAAADVPGRTAYAERLVGWARDLVSPPRLAGAAGLWEGPSQLRRRVALLLDERFEVLRHCGRRWRTLCGLACGIAAVTASLVSLSPAGADRWAARLDEINQALASNTDEEWREKERGTATISGTIVVEGGQPSTVSGWMHSGSQFFYASSFADEGRYTDRFSCEVAAGTVGLKFFPESRYAPAAVGPFELYKGDELEDVVITLKPGVASSLRVIDEERKPVAGASVVKNAFLNANYNGPNDQHTTDAEGNVRLERLVSDTVYEVRVEAPGYQRLLAEDVSFPQDGKPLMLTLRKARPTTGVVRWPSGEPCVGATLKLFNRVEPEGTNTSYSYWGPLLLATADEEGRFNINSLTDGAHYSIVVEAQDASRVLDVSLKAGVAGREILLPERRDLRVRVRGDIEELPKRNGQPYAKIDQSFFAVFEIPKSRSSTSVTIGFDAYLELKPVEGGAEGVFEGLVVDPRPLDDPTRPDDRSTGSIEQLVEVRLGEGDNWLKIVPIDPDPDRITTVEFDLDSETPPRAAPVR